MFIGRTDVEAETPIPWPPDAKSWLIGKYSDAVKNWAQDKKGATEIEMIGWHHLHSMNTRLSKLREIVKDREAWRATVHGLQRVRHNWATDLNWIQWCHPAISLSVPLFSPCPQSFPASGSFSVSWLFASDGQSIGASAWVLPVNIQGRFPLGLTGLISLQSKGLLQHQSLTELSLLYGPTLTSVPEY